MGTNSEFQDEASPTQLDEASVVYTIYCHTHVASSRRYIGLTKLSMMQRWNRHVYASIKVVKKGWSHFANAIRKYGPDAFSHEVLEKCFTLGEANQAEEKWVEHFNARDRLFGFNLLRGGTHTPHPVTNPWERPGFRESFPTHVFASLQTPEARAKQLASMRSPESVVKRSNLTRKAQARPEVKARQRELHDDPDYLMRVSEGTKNAMAHPDVRQNVSEAGRRKWQDPTTRESLSASLREACNRPEVRQTHSDASKALWQDPDYVAKMAARVTSDETRAKLSVASTGRNHSPESIERQRQLYLERSAFCKFCDSPTEEKRTCIKGRVACSRCYDSHKTKQASFLRPDGSFLF